MSERPDPPVADAAPLTLRARTVPAPRPGVPWLAAAVPVVGALGWWALTGSAFAIWFALLGPVIAVAGVADAARGSRRERRRGEREAEAARRRVSADITARQSVERETRRARHPDVAGYLRRPEQVWRPVRARRDLLVVGSGATASEVRVSAGDDPEDAALAAAARTLPDAPVLIELAGGVAVVGPAPHARAVLRALLLQVACARPPGEVEVSGGDEDWVKALPHARPGALRITWATGAVAPAAGAVVFAERQPGAAVPAGCAAVIELIAPDRARLETEGAVREVRVEAVACAQAEVIAAELATRATVLGAQPEPPISLSALRPRQREHARRGLPVAIGSTAGAACELDIVADGPHALVTGMTGSGKSELLVTWVTALCTRFTTADVCFLLADFKGGTAFDALAALPHVTGVISDLDDAGAARAIASLRAEVRAREERLAAAGARDIAEIALPRLLVVVDEFAALRERHPDLETLFCDLAARGRALGIHLILGTQRAGGVFRDALTANCGLRISLRVSDPADSVALLGVADAVALPGDAEGRGLALVRRNADPRPSRVRIALAADSDVRAAGEGAGPRPRAPWLPALPARLDLPPAPAAGGVVLGMIDEPDRQRQDLWLLNPRARGLLVVGGPGTGKSTVLATAAAQVPRMRWIGPDPEAAWDALCAAALSPPEAGTVVAIDDLDALLARYPDEYARAAAAAVERLVREAGGFGITVLACVQRLAGATARIAELFPERLVLATSSRAEHVAAGGEAEHWRPSTPPGRGRLGGRLAQVALPPQVPAQVVADPVPRWQPPEGVSGFVAPRPGEGAVQWWERSGVRVRAASAEEDPVVAEPGERVVIVGTPEQWLARPRLLDRIRAEHPLVVDAACARDLRLLAGERDLPPFVDPARPRAWVYAPGAAACRVRVVPDDDRVA